MYLPPSPYSPGRPIDLLVPPSITLQPRETFLPACISITLQPRETCLPACISLHHSTADVPPTWFFPFSISRLVTLPKGRPRLMTSASLMSLGSLRTWMTRDGTPGLRVSPLNFLLSLPLTGGEGGGKGSQ